MEVHPPPFPEYREHRQLETRDYRVVFWQHQLPPAGYRPEDMGWAELTIDLDAAEDVHEVIEWAERYILDFAEEAPGSEHAYCIYAKIPSDTTLLHIAGVDPTVDLAYTGFRRSHALVRAS
jgi:hypothetical protein